MNGFRVYIKMVRLRPHIAGSRFDNNDYGVFLFQSACQIELEAAAREHRRIQYLCHFTAHLIRGDKLRPAAKSEFTVTKIDRFWLWDDIDRGILRKSG